MDPHLDVRPAAGSPSLRRRPGRAGLSGAAWAVALLGLPCAAGAQVPTPAFSVLGLIESLTLDEAGNPLSAGRVRVNGQEILLPANLLITMPGQYLTLNDLFRGPHPGWGASLAPVQPTSGLALRDTPRPLIPFEIQATGNIVEGRYIAGIVKIVQQDLNLASGFIRSIDPASGELLIGAERRADETPATSDDPDAAATRVRLSAERDKAATRVRLNDPQGKFGKSSAAQFAPGPSPMDERFALDPENASVTALTGFPMCVPGTSAPTSCAAGNRPGAGRRFTCGATAAEPSAPVLAGCRPGAQAPLREGDFVDVAGMLTETAPGSGLFFIAAHALTAHLGIYTSAGRDPAYVFIEESIVGMLGEPFPDIDQEETSRFRTVGFTTDPSRDVDVFVLDGDPELGDEATASGPDWQRLTTLRPQTAGQIGRVRITLPSKSNFLPIRRDVRYRVAGPRAAGQQDSGTYTAPVGEYIYPENTRFGQVPAHPVSVPFENFCALKNGGETLTTLGRTTGPTIGPLNPWPASGHATAQPRADGTPACP